MANKLYPSKDKKAKDFEKLDSEAEWGPPWRTAIRGSQASFSLFFDDTNIASKGLLAPEIKIQVRK